jgi:hypothetical protein
MWSVKRATFGPAQTPANPSAIVVGTIWCGTVSACLAHRRGNGSEFPGELVDCLMVAMAEAYAREQYPDVFDGAVEAIGQNPLDAIG